jgi:hypothetical protein
MTIVALLFSSYVDERLAFYVVDDDGSTFVERGLSAR